MKSRRRRQRETAAQAANRHEQPGRRQALDDTQEAAETARLGNADTVDRAHRTRAQKRVDTAHREASIGRAQREVQRQREEDSNFLEDAGSFVADQGEAAWEGVEGLAAKPESLAGGLKRAGGAMSCGNPMMLHVCHGVRLATDDEEFERGARGAEGMATFGAVAAPLAGGGRLLGRALLSRALRSSAARAGDDVAQAGPKLLGPGTNIGSKIERQLGPRGWTKRLVESTIDDPVRTVPWRDTRHLPGGTRMNDPATAYYGRRGGYVVRNNRTGDIVQVSNRTDPGWRAPWGP